MTMKFSVDLWGSNPDAGNDDCWTGLDFDSYEAAMACYANPGGFFDPRHDLDDTAYFELVRRETFGADGSTEVTRLAKRKNPDFVPSYDDHAWRSEFAMQNGMVFGADGYNDAMGYSTS